MGRPIVIDRGGVDYEKWALAMCELLDEIERALNNRKLDCADMLVRKRFEIAQDQGMEVVFTSIPSGIDALGRDCRRYHRLGG